MTLIPFRPGARAVATSLQLLAITKCFALRIALGAKKRRAYDVRSTLRFEPRNYVNGDIGSTAAACSSVPDSGLRWRYRPKAAVQENAAFALARACDAFRLRAAIACLCSEDPIRKANARLGRSVYTALFGIAVPPVVHAFS